MKIHRSIAEPIRLNPSWEVCWRGMDQGLIACWERGREKGSEDPDLAAKARSGQLVMLPWKGGIKKITKKKEKVGTFFYLAMWQGLRGEDLNIDTITEPVLTCTGTKMTVVYTNDFAKYANVDSEDEDELNTASPSR